MNSCNMTQAELNHLRRLLGWISCEIGQSPEQIEGIVKGLAEKSPVLADAITEPEAAGRLVAWREKSASVPKYVRAAVKALEKTVRRGSEKTEDAQVVAINGARLVEHDE